MLQIYTWAYQDWKKIDRDGLKQVVGVPGGITAADYKTITGEDFEVPTATNEGVS